MNKEFKKKKTRNKNKKKTPLNQPNITLQQKIKRKASI